MSKYRHLKSMSHRFIKVFSLIIVVILVAGAVLLWNRTHLGGRAGEGFSISPFKWFNSVAPSSAGGGGEKVVEPKPADENVGSRYTNTKYNFSFIPPVGFQVSAFPEGDSGDTVLLQSADGKSGFQIFISPFDEEGPITAERIKKDIPDMVIQNPKQVAFPQSAPTAGQVQALAFLSRGSGLGDTKELWFVYTGNLYQIEAVASFDLGSALETWRFSD